MKRSDHKLASTYRPLALARKIDEMTDWLQSNPDRSHEVLGFGVSSEIDEKKHIKTDVLRDGAKRKIVCTVTGELENHIKRFEALTR